MARIFTSGFELNSTTTNVEFSAVGAANGASIQSSTARSGTYAGKCLDTLGAVCTFDYKFASANQSAPYFFRMYINISSLPASGSDKILTVTQTSTTSPLVGIRLTSTGKLQLWREQLTASQIGSDSTATLSTGTWYRIELKVDATTLATTVCDALLDGASFASGNANIAAGQATVRFGHGSAVAATYFLDDLAINDATGTYQNSFPGPEKVIQLKPNASGDANSFATQTGGSAGGSNNYTRVNEIPPDDATSFNGSSTLNEEDLFNMDNSGIASTDIVNVVQVNGRHRNSSTDTAAAIKYEIEKTGSGTKSQSASIIPNSTTWKTNTTALTVADMPPVITLYQDPDSAFWSQTTLDSMQVGYIETANPTFAGRRVDVTALWAHVGYVPSTIKYDNSIQGKSTGGTTSLSLSLVVGSGSNQKTIIMLAIQDSNQNAQTTSVTVGGNAATKVPGATGNNNPGGDRTEIWYYDGLSAGTYTVAISTSGSVNTIQGSALSIFNATSGSPEASTNATTSGASSLSANITTLSDGAWVIDCIMAEAVPTFTGGQTQIWQQQSQSFQNGLGGRQVVTPTATRGISYKMSSSQSASMSVVSIAPQAGGGSSFKMQNFALLGVG